MSCLSRWPSLIPWVYIGVVTDAKPDAVASCARYGFEPLEGVREGALHGDAAPLFLPLSAVDEQQS